MGSFYVWWSLSSIRSISDRFLMTADDCIGCGFFCTVGRRRIRETSIIVIKIETDYLKCDGSHNMLVYSTTKVTATIPMNDEVKTTLQDKWEKLHVYRTYIIILLYSVYNLFLAKKFPVLDPTDLMDIRYVFLYTRILICNPNSISKDIFRSSNF